MSGIDNGKDEVEWGTALLSTNGDVWDEFWHVNRASAEKEIAEDSPEEHAPDAIILVFRTKAREAGPTEQFRGSFEEASK